MTKIKTIKWWEARVAGEIELLRAAKRATDKGVGATRDIYITGEINDAMAADIRYRVHAAPHARFRIHIDSVGGYVKAGLDIAAILQALDRKATAIVVQGCSAALLITLACKYRRAYSDAQFLHHSSKPTHSPTLYALLDHLVARHRGASASAWRALRGHGDATIPFGAPTALALGVVQTVYAEAHGTIATPRAVVRSRSLWAGRLALDRGETPEPAPRRSPVSKRGRELWLTVDSYTVKSLAEAIRSQPQGELMAIGCPEVYFLAAEHFMETGQVLTEWPLEKVR